MTSKLILESQEIETRIENAAELLRTGEINLARSVLLEIYNLEDLPTITRIKNFIQLIIAEWHLGNIHAAWELSLEAKALASKIDDNFLLGQLHSAYALILRQLGNRTENHEHYDAAIMEMTAASFYFEQAGKIDHQSRLENNLALLQSQLKRYDDALSSVEKAIRLTREVDTSQLAFMYDSLAQIYFQMGQIDLAYDAIQTSLRLMPESRETKAFLDVSMTLSKILFKLGQNAEAKSIVEDAIIVAIKHDHLTILGELYMLLLEEGWQVLLPVEIITIYLKAYPILTSDKAKARLTIIAQKLFELLSPLNEKAHIDNLTMRLEKESLKRALANSNGSITYAAAAMNYSYQRVDYLLENTYLDLRQERTPRMKRKKSIVKKFQKK